MKIMQISLPAFVPVPVAFQEAGTDLVIGHHPRSITAVSPRHLKGRQRRGRWRRWPKWKSKGDVSTGAGKCAYKKEPESSSHRI